MKTYGTINGSLIGLTMREMVRCAMMEIHKRRFSFEAKPKPSEKERKDFCTTADTAAQGAYIEIAKRCFPGVGIIAEEGKVFIPCRIRNRRLYLTIDGVDGTKALMRLQSHGIGTMVALVDGDSVAAACVGDVCSEEVYHCDPDRRQVFRLWKFSQEHELVIDTKKLLSQSHILLRDPGTDHSPMAQQLLITGENRLFRSHQVSGGSIGSFMARLWKGEVAAAILEAGEEKPWDYLPVLGLCQRLGLVFLDIDTDRKRLVRRGPPVSLKPLTHPYERLVVHQSRLPELRNWLKKARGAEPIAMYP